MKPLVRACLLLSLLGSAAAAEMTADQAFKLLPTWDYGQPRAPLALLELHIAKATGDAKAKAQVAARLGQLLADAKTSLAAREFICEQLLLVGNDSHVPTLVKMLDAPKTVHMARRALESIPGEKSLQALRNALDTLKGLARVGVVNSLGVRRDAPSVPVIAALLGSRDTALAAAAMEALGKIATPAAADALLKSTPDAKTLQPIRDAQLRCANRLAAAGDRQSAERVFRHLLAARLDARWRMALLSTMVKSCPDLAVEPVLQSLASPDAQVQALAMHLAERLTGQAVTQAMVGRLQGLKPEAQVLLLGVLARRGDRSAAPTVGKLFDAKHEAVRLAAIRAMAGLGGADTVARLAQLAAKAKGATQAAARDGLHRLTGDEVDPRIVALAAKGDPAVRAELLRAIGARGIANANPTLLKAAADPDQGIRSAAVDALALVGDAAAYPRLIKLLGSAATQSDARAAERAVVAVGARLPRPADRVAPLLAALKSASPRARPVLLSILATTGGPDALKAVQGHLSATDATIQTAAVRALSNWPDAAAAPSLLALAKDSPERTHRILALRGYLRLAGEADKPRRLAMLEQVRPIATTTDSKRALLGALGDVPDAGALHIATQFLDDKAVHAEAAAAMLKIANGLLRSDREAVREPMQRLAKTSKDPDVVKQAKLVYEESLKTPATRGQQSAALRPNKKRSQAYRKALAAKAPKGFHLAAYLDCGPDAIDGTTGGPTLKLLDGQAYAWAGGSATAEQLRFTTIFYTGQQVSFEASGLHPKKTYHVGFSWWDYDHNTRAQSVWAAAGKPLRYTRLLDKTRLPAGRSKPPEEKTLPIPRQLTARGTVHIAFRNEGSPNCVVSELWLWESNHESEVKMPAPRKKGGTPVVLLTGIDYPGHKWKQTAPMLADLLLKDPRLDIDVVDDWQAFLASPKLHDYKVCVFHMMNWKTPDPPAASLENFRKFVADGGGLVTVHFACGAFQQWGEFVKIAGRVWNPKLRGHDPHGTFRVEMTDVKHPITDGLKPFDTVDELYTCLDGDTPITILAKATSKVDKKDYPIGFVLPYGKGRVFHCVLGHSVKAFEAPSVGELFRRATAWAAGLPAVPPGK